MKIHKSGMAHGKGEKTMVYYGWRGRQVARRLALPYSRKNTPAWLNSKALFDELSNLWRELPENIRNLWDYYATRQGSASGVEQRDSLTYRYCPIPNYPPRPKLMHGLNAFVGANAKAAAAGLEIPRIYPPIGAAVPPPPGLECRYDHTSKELIINLATPRLVKADKLDSRKAIIWITAGHKARYIAHHLKLDSVDIPAEPKVLELRYKGIEHAGKGNDYQPLAFKDIDYLRMYLGAQVLVTTKKDVAPVASAGTIMPYYILNDRRYFPFEELIQARAIKRIGSIRFSKYFYQKLRAKLNKIGKSEMVQVIADKTRVEISSLL